MSEPIKAGDLVICVRTCCEKKAQKCLGKIRQIDAVSRDETQCEHCRRIERGIHVHRAGKSAPLWWVKRIPPLGELDDVKQEEDLREPA